MIGNATPLGSTRVFLSWRRVRFDPAGVRSGIGSASRSDMTPSKLSWWTPKGSYVIHSYKTNPFFDPSGVIYLPTPSLQTLISKPSIRNHQLYNRYNDRWNNWGEYSLTFVPALIGFGARFTGRSLITMTESPSCNSLPLESRIFGFPDSSCCSGLHSCADSGHIYYSSSIT